MNVALLAYLVCPSCEAPLELSDGVEPAEETIVDGELACAACGRSFPVVHGIPQLLARSSESPTSDLYSDIWSSYEPESATPKRTNSAGYHARAKSHWDLLELASGHDLVVPGIGIDAGCGNGDAVIALTRRHSEAYVVGIDLSSGPMLKAEVVRRRSNADLVRGDLLSLPFVRGAFDFIYSFGVLHHTADPRSAFSKLVERLRPGARITVFVYKDFSDLPVKRFVLTQVNRLRAVTTRLTPRMLRVLSKMLAPLVYVGLAVPARCLRAVGLGRIAQHVPYGTFPDLRTISSSLEDRFGAPNEFRFSRTDLEQWIAEERLVDAKVVDCLPWGFSGLVLTGRKAEES